jgi:cysteinyl-tRNA synthetase
MVLNLYDTMTREVREVFPMDENSVRFYACGPTVYGPAHIGNFRTFVMQDVFRRVLETSGQKTLHVRNLTDVDDKTIRQSQEEGVKLEDFTDKWTVKFQKDCEFLNLLPPHAEPSAVEHIPEQISLIERLIEGGNAYRANDGSVYFKVDAFPDYGRLSRLADREITTS